MPRECLVDEDKCRENAKKFFKGSECNRLDRDGSESHSISRSLVVSARRTSCRAQIMTNNSGLHVGKSTQGVTAELDRQTAAAVEEWQQQ